MLPSRCLALVRASRPRRILCLAALAASVACSPGAWAQADPLVQDATLDVSFSGDGKLLVPFDLRPGNDIGEGAVADGTGGYWVVGRAEIAGGTRLKHYVMAVARVQHDGSLGAMASRPDLELDRENLQGPYYEVQSIAADADGRLLLVVLACTNVQDMASCTSRLLRIARDGSPDVTFDGDGEVRRAITAGLYSGVTAGPGGETWVSGSAGTPGSAQIFRFGAGGEALTSLSAPATFSAFTPPIDGSRYALAGAAGAAAAVYRLDAAGAVDPGFGTAGKVVLARPAGDCGLDSPGYQRTALAAIPDGRVLVHVDLTDDSSRPVLSLVVGVGRQGEAGAPRCIAHIDPALVGLAGSVEGVALREDGRAFLALPDALPSVGTDFGMSALRLRPDGSLVDEPAFNGGQPLSVSFASTSGDQEGGAAAVVLDQGAPVLIGSAVGTQAGYDFALARMLGSVRVFGDRFD
jgi:hypothetical protein